jgi:predicted Na+-dependent transporter
LLGETTLAGLWGLVISAILLPIVCLALSYSLIKYIGDQLDKEVTNGIVLGGTIGYMISMSLLILLGG